MRQGLSALLLSCFLAVPVCAQFQSARLEGTVLDASSAVIPGAKLSILNERTHVKVDVSADAQGYYVFPTLQPGLYTLTAEAPGFRRAKVAHIELNVGVTVRQDVKLDVGAVTESVTVEANAVRVQTTEATIQRIVNLRDIDTLPQIGRNPLGLASFQPGVSVFGSNSSGDASFAQVNGMRRASNNNTLDGIEVNDPVLPRLGLSLNPNNLDSVAEFRMITSGAKAEYGRNAGAQVELITRSGTNQYHGNLFEYHRNTVLNANNFFNNASIPAADRPKLIQNVFGGSVGGPVMVPKLFNGRDRLFFFFNFQGSRTAQEVSRTRLVLTPEAKRGLFRWRAPGSSNISAFDIVANDPLRIGIDKTVAGNLALLPDPNASCSAANCDGLNVAGFRFNSPNPAENEQWTTRIDYNLRPTHRIWYRHSRLRTLSWDSLNNAEPTFPGRPSGTQGGIRWGFSAGSSWTITPRLVNEFTFGHQESSVTFFRVRSLTPGIPLVGSNLFTNPIPTAAGSRRNSPVNPIIDNVSLLKGTHSFKGGFRYTRTTQFETSDGGIWPTITLLRTDAPVATTIGPTGTAVIASADRQRFESLYNDLLGRVGLITTTFYSDLEKFQSAGTPRVRNFVFPDYGGYFQDDWRIRPNLTLNLGLRWEFYGVPSERDKLQGVIDKAALVNSVNQIDNLAIVRSRNWYAKDWNNFAPRIGFAWDPFKDGKTSIRGSWGIFYDRVLGTITRDVDPATPGFAAPIQVFPNKSGTTDIRVSSKLDFPQAAAAPVLTLPANRSQQTLTFFDANFRTPYVLQWNFTVQREVFRNTVVELGYVANNGVKLLADLNWNQPRIYGTFLNDFKQIQDFRRSGVAVPASNMFVRVFGTTAAAVTGIGGTVIDQGAVGTAANTVDTNNNQFYDRAGLSQFFLRNYPQFQNVIVATNAGRSYYHSLQVSVRRQVGALRFAGNYTWSKSTDNTTADGGGFDQPIDNFNFRLNNGRSDADRPHTLNWSTSYILPIGKGRLAGGRMPDWADRILGGWEMGMLGVWTSGPVMTLSSGLSTGPQSAVNTWGNYSGDRNIGEVRRTGNGVFYFSDATIAQLRDTALVPGAGEIGTAGRNTFRGPRYFTTDISLLKKFRIRGERTFVTFRAEAYNLFNKANFSTPGFNLQSPQALGSITGDVGGARRMQMALRFDF